jgi:hypothetical protein
VNTLQIAIVTSAIRARVAELAQHDADTDEAALLAEIERDVPDAQAIVASLVRAIDEAETAMEVVASRMQALAARQKRHRAKAETMRGLLLAVMDAAGAQKWKHPEFTVSVSNGRAAALITDEDALPDDCFRVVREPDKAKIKQLLDAGTPIAGAVLANGVPALTIRTK